MKKAVFFDINGICEITPKVRKMIKNVQKNGAHIMINVINCRMWDSYGKCT